MFESLRYVRVRVPLRFDSIRFVSSCFAPFRFVSVVGSFGVDPFRFGVVPFGPSRFGSVRFGSVRFGSGRFSFGLVPFGSVLFDCFDCAEGLAAEACVPRIGGGQVKS